MARTPIAAPPLVARTELLDPATTPDLVAVAGSDGVLFEGHGAGFAGRGVARRLELPAGLGAPDAADAVASALGSIEVDDRVGLPGCGPVAIGALPFDRTAPASLVVPATVVGRTGSTWWRTTIGPAGAESVAEAQVVPPATAARPHTDPCAFDLRTPLTHAEWCRLVERAVARIRAGGLRKVVLAREVLVDADVPFDRAVVASRLRALHPSCAIYAVDGFVGASPELLVTRRGHEVRSHPLAGTIPRTGDPVTDAALADGLVTSTKEREEHAVVVEAVAAALRPMCTSIDVPAAPSVVPLRNVAHLGTLVEGHLVEPAPTALALAARLHPTPAVAGTPRAEATELLRELEGLDRGRYAGAVGWVDGRGDGTWAVGIRAVELDGTRARMLAGVGVVADSDPAAELAETQLKLQAVLAAVVRP